MRFLIFLLTIFSQSIFGQQLIDRESCNEVDILEGQPEKVKEAFERPRHQWQFSWCYAISASDLMTVHAGEPVSAVQAAIITNREVHRYRNSTGGFLFGANLAGPSNGQEIIQGGDISISLKLFKNEPIICSSDQLTHTTQSTLTSIGFALNSIEQTKRRFTQRDIGIGEACQNVMLALSGYDGANLHAEAMAHVAYELLTQNLNESLDSLAKETCKDTSISIPPYEVQTRRNPGIGDSFGDQDFLKQIQESKRDDYIKSLNNVLESGRPLAMDYKLSGFMNGYNEQNELHSSTILGRKWMNGRCHFKVRNSFGRQCERYHPEVESDPDSGSFYMSDKEFIEHSLRIHAVKNKEGSSWEPSVISN